MNDIDIDHVSDHMSIESIGEKNIAVKRSNSKVNLQCMK